KTRKNTISVSCRTLDSWVSSLGIDPQLIGFVKCDVQGWESNVLEGAQHVLGQHRHIVWQFEVSPKHLEAAGSSLQAFSARVGRHFERFIDVDGDDIADRSTASLEDSLQYLQADPDHYKFTDILAYNTH
ncbi:MAG: FkbM family methyltransferase, partial [Acidobacteriota bacterium]|nr:FkbM family methyltransferase [Acidobacteriota bacterium]